MRKPSLRILLPLVVVAAAMLSGQDAPPPGASPQAVIGFLNDSIHWYRDVLNQDSIAYEPGEVLYVNQDRQQALQALRLGFDFAHAQAALLGARAKGATTAPPAGTEPTDDGSSRRQRMADLLAHTSDSIAAVKTQQAKLEEQAAHATGKQRKAIDAERGELQAEFDLLQAKYETLKNLSDFIRTATVGNEGVAGLNGQISELERTVPELQKGLPATQPGAEGQPKPAPSAGDEARRTESSGIFALATDLIGQRRKIHAIDQQLAQTAELRQSLNGVRSPLSQALIAASRAGDQISQAPDTTDPVLLQQQRQQLEALTTRFRQLSTAAVPLGKMAVLLDQVSNNLQDWRTSVSRDNLQTARVLAIKLSVLLLFMAVLFAISELWRRATFRYIRDARRRSQFLLLRRIVMAIVIVIIVTVALVTQAGSLATYAGFVTAGLAVALQNVILSVVAYFFLIGRYGIHVGDRVTISGVTGDVMEIGLIRLHLIELSGAGDDMHPTGRVVVFSNSVILQPTGSFFKQMPGADFVWHEVRLTLAPKSDYGRIEEALTQAVQETYNHDGKPRHFVLPRIPGEVSLEDPKPKSRLRLTAGGLEIAIRYPVDTYHSSAFDDRVTRAILSAIASRPDLRMVPTTAPNLQPVAAAEPAD